MRPSTIDILPLTKDDIPQAASTLYHAFKNDSMMQWLFVTKENYQQYGEVILGTWIKYGVLYGMAYRTPNFESIAIRRKSGDQLTSFWRMLRSGMITKTPKMGKQSMKRITEMSDILLKEQQKNMGKRPFIYCWILGTHPQHQGKRFGSALMNHTFQLATKEQLPCYLETCDEHAEKVHRHKGYQLLSQFTLPDSNIKMSAMVTGPRE